MRSLKLAMPRPVTRLAYPESEQPGRQPSPRNAAARQQSIWAKQLHDPRSEKRWHAHTSMQKRRINGVRNTALSKLVENQRVGKDIQCASGRLRAKRRSEPSALAFVEYGDAAALGSMRHGRGLPVVEAGGRRRADESEIMLVRRHRERDRAEQPGSGQPLQRGMARFVGQRVVVYLAGRLCGDKELSTKDTQNVSSAACAQ